MEAWIVTMVIIVAEVNISLKRTLHDWIKAYAMCGTARQSAGIMVEDCEGAYECVAKPHPGFEHPPSYPTPSLDIHSLHWPLFRKDFNVGCTKPLQGKRSSYYTTTENGPSVLDCESLRIWVRGFTADGLRPLSLTSISC